MWRVVLLAATVVACGPSTAEIKTAKTATYRLDPVVAFRLATEATAETYKIAERDDQQQELITTAVWYDPEGGRQSAGAGDFATVGDRYVQLSLIVEVAPGDGGSAVRIVVTPKTFQHISGSPKPREILPTDPNLPGWVSGRVDALHFEIHKRIQQYEKQ